jgi:hypothetical protein
LRLDRGCRLANAANSCLTRPCASRRTLGALIIAAANASARLVLEDPAAYGEERMVAFVSEVVRSIQEG